MACGSDDRGHGGGGDVDESNRDVMGRRRWRRSRAAGQIGRRDQALAIRIAAPAHSVLVVRSRRAAPPDVGGPGLWAGKW